MAVGNAQRYRILKRDRFTCQYCGASGCELEVDHINPVCRGGVDDDDNLRTACCNCNRGKSGDSAPEMPVTKLFAMTNNGHYGGLVKQETDDNWRVELFDAFMFIGLGQLVESGEIRDMPKSDTRIFTDAEAYCRAISLALRDAHAAKA